MAADSSKTTVFYDGSCPLCRREIGVYQRRDQGAAIDWVDVSACDAGQLPRDLDREAALARFHVRRGPDGKVLSGASAFAEMWANTQGFRLLGRVAKEPPVTTVLEATYRWFLKIRPRFQAIARRLDR